MRKLGKFVTAGMLGLLAIVAGPCVFAVDVETKLDAVTVFGSGAMISRLGRVSLGDGDNSIKIVDLPPDIDETRVRVSLVSGEGELGQVRIMTAERSEAFNQTIETLNTRIRETNAELRALSDSTATAQLQLKFLEGIAQGYAKESWFEGARGNANISSWREALNLLGTGADDASKRIRDNEARAVSIKQELAKLQRELARLNGQRQGATEVLLTVRAPRANSAVLQIVYYEDDAHWYSDYEARLDSSSGRLEFLQRAQVEQQTHESWENIKLTLSSAEPSDELELEDIYSWVIDLLPQKEEEVVVTAEYRKSRVDQNVRSSVPMIEEVVVTAAKIESNRIDVLYHVPGRVDVPNVDGTSAPFDLNVIEFDAELVTKVAPENSDFAFLEARVEYQAETPLPAALMYAYVDGAYVGETNMPGMQLGETVDIPFGQDRLVDIKVKTIEDAGSTSGIIGRRQVETFKKRISIANRRTSPTTVEVFARYPVPRNDKIKVRVLPEATPATEEDYDGERGVVMWRKTLQGSDDWQIDYQAELSYPKGESLDW